MAVMDDLKKQMTYKLGLLYEKMGDRKSYLERMKEIYDIDYGYRDVAKRVESSYERVASTKKDTEGVKKEGDMWTHN
jgi:hypothetical protein